MSFISPPILVDEIDILPICPSCLDDNRFSYNFVQLIIEDMKISPGLVELK